MASNQLYERTRYTDFAISHPHIRKYRKINRTKPSKKVQNDNEHDENGKQFRQSHNGALQYEFKSFNAQQTNADQPVQRRISILHTNVNNLHHVQSLNKKKTFRSIKNSMKLKYVENSQVNTLPNNLKKSISSEGTLAQPTKIPIVNNGRINDHFLSDTPSLASTSRLDFNSSNVRTSSRISMLRNLNNREKAFKPTYRPSTVNNQNIIFGKKRSKIKDRQCCFILSFVVVFTFVVTGVIAAILGILFKDFNKKSNTSTNGTSNTSITTNCSTVANGNLLTLNGSTPTSWTQYQFNYTAINPSLMIMFGFKTEHNQRYYLDDVSIVDVNASATQLLQNPSFENSSTVPISWSQFCTSTCSGNAGTITAGANCYSGKCFVDNCYAGSGADFIAQSINTTIGQIYTISFMLNLVGSGTTSDNAFYAGVQ